MSLKKFIKQYAKYLDVEDYVREVEKSNQDAHKELVNLKVKYDELQTAFKNKDKDIENKNKEKDRLQFRNTQLNHRYAELELRYHELLSKIN